MEWLGKDAFIARALRVLLVAMLGAALDAGLLDGLVGRTIEGAMYELSSNKPLLSSELDPALRWHRAS